MKIIHGQTWPGEGSGAPWPVYEGFVGRWGGWTKSHDQGNSNGHAHIVKFIFTIAYGKGRQ